MERETETGCCKVGRNISKYDLFEFNRELRQRKSSGDSLRDLATFTNTRLLERALAAADAEVIGDSETIYRTLTSDDIRPSKRTELRSKLEQQRVNIDEITRDFVSHQTVRDHLKGCLDVDTSRQLTVDFEKEQGTVEWARARSEKVIRRVLDRLRQAEELHTGPLDVTHSVRVTCETCGRSYRLRELLAARQCACHEEE